MKSRSYLGSARGMLLLVAGAFMLAHIYLIFMWVSTEEVQILAIGFD